MAPPFDPEAFARESESKLRAGRTLEPEPISDRAPSQSSAVIARARPIAREEPLDENDHQDDDEEEERPTRPGPAVLPPREALPSLLSVPPPTPRAPRADAVPMLAVRFAEVPSLRLDHRAGFLLSLIDGTSSVEMILDVCGMPGEEALALLEQFLERGIVVVR